MGDYIVTNKGLVSTDELMHYAKGSEGKNHKYYKREWKNGGWQYYYSKDQYTADKVIQMVGAEDEQKRLQKDAQDARYYANQMVKVGNSKRSDQVYALSKDGRYWSKGSRNNKDRNSDRKEALLWKKDADELARKAEKAGKQREHAARDIARVETDSKSYKLGLKVRAKKAKAAYYKNKAAAWLKKTTKSSIKSVSKYVSKGKSLLSKYINTQTSSGKKGNTLYLNNGKTKVTFSDVTLSDPR